mmetsp:Transcript_19398/g.28675  ORF Transcript_19398/g.28675 Transcript_19398/m.28675 type:complete len:217 (+) Transcript_19398:290-940(+)
MWKLIEFSKCPLCNVGPLPRPQVLLRRPKIIYILKRKVHHREQEQKRHEQEAHYSTKNKPPLQRNRIHTKRWPNLILVIEHVTQYTKVYAPLQTFGIEFRPRSRIRIHIPLPRNFQRYGQIKYIIIEKRNHEIFSPEYPLRHDQFIFNILSMDGYSIFTRLLQLQNLFDNFVPFNSPAFEFSLADPKLIFENISSFKGIFNVGDECGYGKDPIGRK